MKVIFFFLNLLVMVPVVVYTAIGVHALNYFFRDFGYFVLFFSIGVILSMILPGVFYLRKSITLQDFLIMSFAGPTLFFILFYFGVPK